MLGGGGGGGELELVVRAAGGVAELDEGWLEGVTMPLLLSAEPDGTQRVVVE